MTASRFGGRMTGSPQLGRVLVVDDRSPVREVLREELVERGCAVLEAKDGLDALQVLRHAAVDLVVTDVRMPRLDGFELLQRITRNGPPAMLFSAYGDVPTAVDAMRAGAIDFVSLPVDSGELAARIVTHLRGVTERSRADSPIVGQHPAVVDLQRRIGRVARRNVTVLITGESGVGKELVAREIHRQSPRAEGPFVAVSCCALTESLLESELFGHEKGAFTGATALKTGRFERADGGTLFLDEIGDAPPATQAKLLRVLQEQEFERVGGLRTIRVNVRVVAATNRDLGEMRDRGGFRDDLFHRLNVFPLHVPPLRERASDLPRLLEAFCARSRLELQWTEAALDRLTAHAWPGNVRELENCVERIGILCDGRPRVTLQDVERALDAVAPPGRSAREAFAEDERTRLEALLREHRWNVSAVARELGVSRGALRHRLRKYGLQ